MAEIALVLEILDDGKWHEIGELQQRLDLNEKKMQKITAFLNKYDFVKIDSEHGKVKINRNFQKLLAQTVI